jgi:hypothetical protein
MHRRLKSMWLICMCAGAMAFAIALGTLPGVARDKSPATTVAGVHFEDITRVAGIHFVHNNGAFGKKWLPETMGSGAAFLDYDNDGWQDILFVNGADWPGHGARRSTLALYHNNHDGTFTDVTQKAGLAVEMEGMGVAIGDFDNDGYDDIFVTAYGQNHLFHNDGHGTFTDVTKHVGLWGPNEFSTSAAWVDYDRDGHLDLVVANYVQWSPETDLYCTIDGKTKSYCTPESYKGTSLRLWHNRGDGTFEDATQKAGLYDPTSKNLGVAILDANQDGWPDILVSNDTQPNKLYINNGNGTFTEKGVPSGIAYSEDGVARAGMGVDAADYDRSGYPSVLITNFANQMIGLYHNERSGLFIDEAPNSSIGRASLLTLGFGCFFFDYDLDGWLDVYVANGHIDDAIERVQPRVKYAEPPHLFRNLGNGKFDVTTNGGPAVLFRNTGAKNHSLRVRLVGTKSNRDGIGAVVRVTAGSDVQSEMLRSGSSYLSSSELVLTFGLAGHEQADAIEVRWPSGQIDRASNVAADQIITVKEGSGVFAAKPLAKRLPKN